MLELLSTWLTNIIAYRLLTRFRSFKTKLFHVFFSACPTCIDPKVCVIDGSTASCQCPKYYHDDVFGGCTRSIGINFHFAYEGEQWSSQNSE